MEQHKSSTGILTVLAAHHSNMVAHHSRAYARALSALSRRKAAHKAANRQTTTHTLDAYRDYATYNRPIFPYARPHPPQSAAHVRTKCERVRANAAAQHGCAQLTNLRARRAYLRMRSGAGRERGAWRRC